jgi:hypothetical protein
LPGPPRLPDFLILGAPKSGTTSLAAWLDARDDVLVPPQKELHFFSRDDRWEQGLDWYSPYFEPAGDRLAGEATPNYLDDPKAPERIAATAPGARLIAILRDPVDRAWSHYSYDRDLALNEVPPFDDVVRGAGGPAEHRYLSQGRYVRHLERYVEHVPREQLLVLWFDDLRDRPAEVWKEVCSFVGIPVEPVPEAVGSVHNRHYRLRARWVRDLMIRGRAWRRLPFGLAGRIDKLLRAEGGYDDMAPAHRARLRESFAADDRALEAWLGRPCPPGWAR